MKNFIAIFILIFPILGMTKVIDNLNDKRAEWVPFSDQVMGGVSEVKFSEKSEKGISFYHMEGNVSTENNGGFIQFRADLGIEDKAFKGFRIKTRGNGEQYYLFLRTSKTRLPWLYYGATFKTSQEWQWIEIPFSSFKKSEGRLSRFVPEEFNPTNVKNIGIVAYGKDFYADIDVAALELY